MSKVVKYGLIAAGAGLAVILIARASKKPTIGDAVGQIVDGTKTIVDRVGGKARLADNAPFAAHSAVADSQGFARMTGVGPQPEGMSQMDYTQRATAGLQRNSKFGF